MAGEGGSSPAGGKVGKESIFILCRGTLTDVLVTGWLWQRHAQTSYNQANTGRATAASRCRLQSRWRCNHSGMLLV
jgi:hypothetical protein